MYVFLYHLACLFSFYYIIILYRWNLGEHDIWCKMTNYETGTRVPLLFRAPWMKNAVNVKVKQLAELVDMYPTLSELVSILNPTKATGKKKNDTLSTPALI